MADEIKHLVLPPEDEGDVTIRALGSGTVALEGWVGSCDGHRHALDRARQETDARMVEDRLAIVLGRCGHDPHLS